MRRSRRLETHRNRCLRDNRGVRDIESGRENVLIEAVGVSVQR